MERPVVAFVLALVAGTLSGFTFYTVRLFSTVQSGNVVQAGYQVAEHSDELWKHAVIAIVCFGLGSAATAALENVLAGFHTDYSLPVLLFEAAVLFLLGFAFVHDRWSAMTYAYVVSFLAGMQGSAFHKVDGLLYGNVAVTMVVQFAFEHLARAVFADRRTHLLRSAIFFLVLSGFALGGFVGAWGTRTQGQKVLWLAATLLLLVAAEGTLRRKREGGVDIPVTG